MVPRAVDGGAKGQVFEEAQDLLNAVGLLDHMHKKTETTFLFSAHDERIFPFASRRIELQNGEIISDKTRKVKVKLSQKNN
ncbi:MAG: hypothetical protein ABUK01_05255 [Leptospirales bacterium]